MFIVMNDWRVYCDREERVPSRCADLSDSGILVSVKRVECDALSQG